MANALFGAIRYFPLVLLVLFAAGSSRAQTASGELAAGVEAFKAGRYELAIQHFQAAVQLDPKLDKAHLYLGTVYAQMYVPGLDSADNLAASEKSMAEFQWVLDHDPSPQQKLQVLHNLASLNFQMKHFESATEYYDEVLALEPNNPETYYAIAVIDWMEAYQPRMELRNSMGLTPTDNMPPGTGCSHLRASNQEKVEDGIHQLKEALKIRPDYDDAMAYMNLLYREKADYECDDPAARAADLQTADHWVDLTMQTKAAKAKSQGSSIPLR